MDKPLTVEEIADLLGVRPGTIYQWTHEGFVPHIKLGRLLRFKEKDVAKWLEKRSTNGRVTRIPSIITR